MPKLEIFMSCFVTLAEHVIALFDCQTELAATSRTRQDIEASD